MKAIVYFSTTGFTEHYAKLLSEKTGLPAYTLKQAKKELPDGEQVVYLGWIMAGGVKGLAAAQKKFDVKACCAVGATPVAAQNAEQMKEKNKWAGDGFFILQGGYAPDKLKGFNKLAMGMVAKSTVKKLKATENRNAEQEEMLAGMQNGMDKVTPEALEPVTAFLSGK